MLMKKKVGIKERTLIKESMNLDSLKGVVKLVKSILIMTLIFESIGVILSYIVFSKDYAPLDALGISLFHSIAAFNNSGFDILGGLQNLIPYQNNILLNLTTCGLIIFGGIGFLVIKEIIEIRSLKKFTLHTKIVLIMTGILLIVGTILLKLTENISWLGAFFFSTSARTAGFSTYSLSTFTNAGLFVLIILMFIGASPGSTGGGIKTTTLFTLYKSIYSTSTNRHCVAFKRKIPLGVILKSFNITILALFVICIGTFTLSILESNYTFMQLLFEVTSAFGTVGLSTGITPDLSDLSKFIISLIIGFDLDNISRSLSLCFLTDCLDMLEYALPNIIPSVNPKNFLFQGVSTALLLIFTLSLSFPSINLVMFSITLSPDLLLFT